MYFLSSKIITLLAIVLLGSYVRASSEVSTKELALPTWKSTIQSLPTLVMKIPKMLANIIEHFAVIKGAYFYRLGPLSKTLMIGGILFGSFLIFIRLVVVLLPIVILGMLTRADNPE